MLDEQLAREGLAGTLRIGPEIPFQVRADLAGYFDLWTSKVALARPARA